MDRRVSLKTIIFILLLYCVLPLSAQKDTGKCVVGHFYLKEYPGENRRDTIHTILKKNMKVI